MGTSLETWKEFRHVEDPETGEPDMEQPPVEKELFEFKADGKDVPALTEMMGDVGDVHMQQAYNRERKYGVAVCSDPNGTPVRVLQTEVADLEKNGFNQRALKSTFRVSGFGMMQKLGIRRQRIGPGYIETWYRDGRYTIEDTREEAQVF